MTSDAEDWARIRRDRTNLVLRSAQELIRSARDCDINIKASDVDADGLRRRVEAIVDGNAGSNPRFAEDWGIMLMEAMVDAWGERQSLRDDRD